MSIILATRCNKFISFNWSAMSALGAVDGSSPGVMANEVGLTP
jgi:hypothetical protein